MKAKAHRRNEIESDGSFVIEFPSLLLSDRQVCFVTKFGIPDPAGEFIGMFGSRFSQSGNVTDDRELSLQGRRTFVSCCRPTDSHPGGKHSLAKLDGGGRVA